MNQRIFGVRGIGIVQVLVAFALIAGLSVVVTTLITQSLKGAKTVAQNTSFTQLKGDVGETLSVLGYCQLNEVSNSRPFMKKTNSPETFPAAGCTTSQTDFCEKSMERLINTHLDTVVAEKNLSYFDFILSDIRVRYQKKISGERVPVEKNVPQTGWNTNYVEVYIKGSRQGSQMGGDLSTLGQPLRLSLITDATTNEVIGCGIPADLMPHMCMPDSGTSGSDFCPLVCTYKGQIRFSNGGGNCAASSIIAVISKDRWIQEFRVPGGSHTRLILDISQDQVNPEMLYMANGTTLEYLPRLCHNHRQVSPDWGFDDPTRSDYKYGSVNYCTCANYDGRKFAPNCGNAIYWRSENLGDGNTQDHPKTQAKFGPSCSSVCDKFDLVVVPNGANPASPLLNQTKAP